MVFMMTMDLGAIAHPFVPQPACGASGWWGSIDGPDSNCWEWQWASGSGAQQEGANPQIDSDASKVTEAAMGKSNCIYCSLLSHLRWKSYGNKMQKR